MRQIDLKRYKQIRAGKKVVIVCSELVIDGPCTIGENVSITAKKIHIGSGANIEKNTTVRALNKTMESFILGDQSRIGFGNQILLPSLIVGDYSQIYNSCLLSGYADLTMGHNCWVGQQSILNATDKLTIMNNVRIGTQSRLWTHVASGELLEGCTLYEQKPLTLEDNVWIIGGATISPGLILRRNTVVLSGAVLTKSTKPYHTYAGVPAVDITDKLKSWKNINLNRKYALIKSFAEEFIQQNPHYKERIKYAFSIEAIPLSGEDVYIIKEVTDWNKVIHSSNSIFDLKTKQYLKRRTLIEIEWMHFIVGYRARFIPKIKLV